jgi:hypothetical protein
MPELMRHQYLEANATAGYSGFVVYWRNNVDQEPSSSVWMIPGTFEHDWDNQLPCYRCSPNEQCPRSGHCPFRN